MTELYYIKKDEPQNDAAWGADLASILTDHVSITLGYIDENQFKTVYSKPHLNLGGLPHSQIFWSFHDTILKVVAKSYVFTLKQGTQVQCELEFYGRHHKC